MLPINNVASANTGLQMIFGREDKNFDDNQNTNNKREINNNMKKKPRQNHSMPFFSTDENKNIVNQENVDNQEKKQSNVIVTFDKNDLKDK